MAKEKIITYPERCKGCHYCLSACKKGALSVSEFTNKKGHKAIEANAEKCVACGSCFTVCPDYVFELVEEAGA
ncbi:oxidoreductase [Deltaproteobacteria bacterium Smac51]|nr:oxidoreductase [Deltaproteobacteria bacterium Smac51]